MMQNAKYPGLIFQTLAGWICLVLHIMVVLIAINHLTSINYLAGWQNDAKCGQLCVKIFKISIFHHFIDFDKLKSQEVHFFDFHKLKSFDRFNTEVEPVRKDVDSSHQR